MHCPVVSPDHPQPPSSSSLTCHRKPFTGFIFLYLQVHNLPSLFIFIPALHHIKPQLPLNINDLGFALVVTFDLDLASVVTIDLDFASVVTFDLDFASVVTFDLDFASVGSGLNFKLFRWTSTSCQSSCRIRELYSQEITYRWSCWLSQSRHSKFMSSENVDHDCVHVLFLSS